MRILIHAIFIILLGLVTFFGIGPVLFADGVLKERIISACLVLVLYIVLVLGYRKSLRWVKGK